MNPTATTYPKLPMHLLGRLLLRNEPELARRLIEDYEQEAKPRTTDLTQIPALFDIFCTLQGLASEDYIGQLRKTPLVDTRRIFLAVILHFYAPQVFRYRQALLNGRKDGGLIKALARLFQTGNTIISRQVHEAIRWQSLYEDFAETVLHLVTQIEASGQGE